MFILATFSLNTFLSGGYQGKNSGWEKTLSTQMS
jgi:hypothetical protein